jgi:biopolymer transport protein ExbB/biopolymer transport protein TolQ
MLAAHTAGILSHIPAAATWIIQEGGGMPTDPLGLWKAMGWVARTVVVILFIMSGWSIGVMIDRFMAYNAARLCPRGSGSASRWAH